MKRVITTLLLCILLIGCANRYKNWAIGQTYGHVPCVTISVDQIVDGSDYPPLWDAPIDTWIVTCKEEVYLCTWRYESAGFTGAMWGAGGEDQERKCQPLKELEPEIQELLDKRKQTTGSQQPSQK